MPALILQSIADRFVLSNGWRRALAAFLAGAVGALAMPPLALFPLLVVTMTIAVWLLDGAVAEFHEGSNGSQHLANAWVAAKIGWWIGFGYHVAGLWWLGAAFLVEADQFAWALPLGVVGLPAGLAIFTAFGFFLARLFWTTGPSRILILALALAVSEWLRGNILTGFPWNDFGMAFGANLLLAQIASIVGVNGLTLLAVAICAAPAVLADRPSGSGGTAKLSVLTAGLALISLCALLAFGALRLAVPPLPSQPNVRLRIMQPNLAQDEKFRGENKDAILKHYLDLSDRATSPQTSGVADVTHLIWPESAFPFILSRDVDALKLLGAFLPPATTLITGAARLEQGPQLRGQRAQNRYYNAIQVIQSGGMIYSSYDKVHLVPFGEYLPFGRWVEAIGLRQFVHIPGGFEAGPRRMTLRVPGLPAVAPLICYEAIFSGEVMPADSSSERPELMLNVTNDAWFGVTPGPYQHFAQARLRAIEEGLPLVRAANTGISAIVDPYGRVLSQLPLGVEGVLDGALPKPLTPTLFARYSQLAPLGLWLFLLLCAGLLRLAETRRPR